MSEHPNDHDILIRLDEKVSGMVFKLDSLHDDHEARIRAVEKWRWISASLGTAGGGSIAYIIEKFVS